MEEKQLKELFRKVLREELKDPNKTLNRLYEDREDIVSIKTTVKDLKDKLEEIITRLPTFEKRIREDLADHKEDLEKTASVVENAATEVKEAIGGGEDNERSDEK